MSANSVIEIKNLEFAYPGKPPVLSIADLKIFEGESVFIYGPSGSGKTTLLGLISGVIENQSGQIRILGKDLAKMSSSARDIFRGNHIGYIFQLFNLIPYLSVGENIRLSCEMNSTRKNRLKSDLKNATNEIAMRLGLQDYLHSKVTQLSVGQQQRVAAARALLGQPEIIIADEPTSALDADHRTNFIQLLFEQCRASRSTLIFVSHDKSLTSAFDRSIDLTQINRRRT